MSALVPGISESVTSTSSEQILDENGVVVDTYHPTVIVSANNLKVITSYPTHYSDDC